MLSSKDLSKATLQTIIIEHMEHYLRLMARSMADEHSRIRLPECKELHAVWEGAQTCLQKGLPLSDEAEAELRDALTSGDYDWALSPEELEKLHAQIKEA